MLVRRRQFAVSKMTTLYNFQRSDLVLMNIVNFTCINDSVSVLRLIGNTNWPNVKNRGYGEDKKY